MPTHLPPPHAGRVPDSPLLADGLLHDIFEAEWSHRQALQRQLQETRQWLLELLLLLAPEIVHERLAAQAPEAWTPANWQALVQAARASGRGWWQEAERRQMRARVIELGEEVQALRRQAAAVQAEALRWRAEAQAREDAVPHWSLASRGLTPATVLLPPLPAQPPPAFAADFPATSWPRSSQLIALLALTGWAQERLLSETLAARHGIAASSGSLRRLFRRLHEQGYVQRFIESHALGRSAFMLLTARGRRLAQALHLRPEASEWQHLQAQQPAASPARRALLCLLAAWARQRGYAAQLAPPLFPEADALLGRGHATWWGVLLADDPAAPHPHRWQALCERQGELMVCVPTPEQEQALQLSATAMGLRGRSLALSRLREAAPGDWPWQRFGPEVV